MGSKYCMGKHTFLKRQSRLARTLFSILEMQYPVHKSMGMQASSSRRTKNARNARCHVRLSKFDGVVCVVHVVAAFQPPQTSSDQCMTQRKAAENVDRAPAAGQLHHLQQ